MFVTSCVNHVLSLRNLISALLVKHLSSTCSEPPSVLILVLRAMAQTKISLKDLMALKSQKVHDYSQTNIEELGQIKLAVGRKYKGVSFAEIYLDDSYNTWVPDHVIHAVLREWNSTPITYAVVSRWRSSGFEQANRKRPSSTSVETHQREHGRFEHRPPDSSTRESLRGRDGQLVSDGSQMTEMEENMTQMKDRMLTLESMVGQVLQYLQQSQQAALADPQGAGPQDP